MAEASKPLTLFVGTMQAAEQWARFNGWSRTEFDTRLVSYLRYEKLRGTTEYIQIIHTDQNLEGTWNTARSALELANSYNRLYEKGE